MTWEIAVHEAGHAVIGRVLGLHCGQVSIVQNEAESEAGHSILLDPWYTASVWDQAFMEAAKRGDSPGKYRDIRCALRRRIIALMAGAEAELLIVGRCEGGDGSDLYDITMVLESRYAEISEQAWLRWEPRARQITRRLIETNKPAVLSVARALLERGKLQPDEITSIVAAAPQAS